ncbi:hypothetical protein WR25_21236 [Diploscapter pachys]|uniref:Calcineurin-like phosphoesterase domain-containing protein n=1 Tax=Diploscapter pachys TaxID=2018661 RepID=A0A2A2JD12_9BILA|nr:hypothetical protein WR25_21236 [Diploscapter pachys]
MKYFIFPAEAKLSKCERAKNRIQQNRERATIIFVVFSILAQANYFMYYTGDFLQWLLFDVTGIALGFWTNFSAFVLGFFLVNQFTQYFYRFSIVQRIVDFFGQVSFIHSLTFDRRTQIRFSFVVALVMSIAMLFSSDRILVKDLTLKIPNFSAKEGKLKLAMVSDLHAGASVYEEQIAHVADKLLNMDVDAVLIVGDMVDGTREQLEERLKPLWVVANRFPTYFVTGNHDYYYGNVEEWLDLYREKNIKVLTNNASMVKGVCLTGVNDISSGKMGIKNHKMNISQAIKWCPAKSTKILLAHNPASVLEASRIDLQSIDLILSGHTHAGQFYVVLPAVLWFLPYFYGVYDLSNLGGHTLMISAGTLYQGPPMKMLRMSEIWNLTIINGN